MNGEPELSRNLKPGDRLEVTATGSVTVDRVETPQGPFMQHWLCEAPAWGASFKVKRDHWDDSTDPPIRYIDEIQVVSLDADWSKVPGQT